MLTMVFEVWMSAVLNILFWKDGDVIARGGLKERGAWIQEILSYIWLITLSTLKFNNDDQQFFLPKYKMRHLIWIEQLMSRGTFAKAVSMVPMVNYHKVV